eukprot:258641-Amphidinium_carterae.2
MSTCLMLFCPVGWTAQERQSFSGGPVAAQTRFACGRELQTWGPEFNPGWGVAELPYIRRVLRKQQGANLHTRCDPTFASSHPLKVFVPSSWVSFQDTQQVSSVALSVERSQALKSGSVI